MSAVAMETLGSDCDKVLEAVVIGAASALAFAFGELAACPGKKALDDIVTDVVWGVTGAAVGEFLSILTGNRLATAVLAGFVMGFVITLVDPDNFAFS